MNAVAFCAERGKGENVCWYNSTTKNAKNKRIYKKKKNCFLFYSHPISFFSRLISLCAWYGKKVT